LLGRSHANGFGRTTWPS